MGGSSSTESKPDVEPVTPSSSSSSGVLPPDRSEVISEELHDRLLRLVEPEEPDVEPVTPSSSRSEVLPPDTSEATMIVQLEEPYVPHMMYSSISSYNDEELFFFFKRRVKPVKLSRSFQLLPPDMSELRVVLLGNSWSQSSSVGNFILGETKFSTEEEPDCCQRERGQLKEKEIVLINTPDLLFPSILQHRLRRPVENCVRLSDPGPHVFLLVLQPEDFTEEVKLRLCRVLKLFSDRSFDHSLVLISTPREESPGFMEKYMNHPPLKDMIRKCHYRFLWRKNLELPELLTRLGQIVRENDEQHLSLPEVA